MAERGEKGSKEDKIKTKRSTFKKITSKISGVGGTSKHQQSQTDGATTHELQERSPEHEHVRMKRSVSPGDESAATGFRSQRLQTFSGRSGDYQESHQPVPLSPKEAKRQERQRKELREKEERQRKELREKERQRKEEEKQRKVEEWKVKKAQPKKSKSAGVLPGRKGRSEVAMSPTKGVPESPVLESVDRGTTVSPVGNDGVSVQWLNY